MVPATTLKLHLCGDEGAGKTTLSAALRGGPRTRSRYSGRRPTRPARRRRARAASTCASTSSTAAPSRCGTTAGRPSTGWANTLFGADAQPVGPPARALAHRRRGVLRGAPASGDASSAVVAAGRRAHLRSPAARRQGGRRRRDGGASGGERRGCRPSPPRCVDCRKRWEESWRLREWLVAQHDEFVARASARRAREAIVRMKPAFVREDGPPRWERFVERCRAEVGLRKAEASLLRTAANYLHDVGELIASTAAAPPRSSCSRRRGSAPRLRRVLRPPTSPARAAQAPTHSARDRRPRRRPSSSAARMATRRGRGMRVAELLRELGVCSAFPTRRRRRRRRRRPRPKPPSRRVLEPSAGARGGTRALLLPAAPARRCTGAALLSAAAPLRAGRRLVGASADDAGPRLLCPPAGACGGGAAARSAATTTRRCSSGCFGSGARARGGWRTGAAAAVHARRRPRGRRRLRVRRRRARGGGVEARRERRLGVSAWAQRNGTRADAGPRGARECCPARDCSPRAGTEAVAALSADADAAPRAPPRRSNSSRAPRRRPAAAARARAPASSSAVGGAASSLWLPNGGTCASRRRTRRRRRAAPARAATTPPHRRPPRAPPRGTSRRRRGGGAGGATVDLSAAAAEAGERRPARRALRGRRAYLAAHGFADGYGRSASKRGSAPPPASILSPTAPTVCRASRRRRARRR